MTIWQPNPKIIQHQSPNQVIILYRGFSELINGDQVIEGKSYIQISWYPHPTITVKFIYHGEDRTELGKVDLKLTELFPQTRIKVHFSGATYYGTGKNEFFGYLAEPLRRGEVENLSSLTFYIPNFYWFDVFVNDDDYENMEAEIDKNENSNRLESWLSIGCFDGQFIFTYQNWRIYLSALEGGFELEEKLDAQGGYGVNHICMMKRLDNRKFNLNEAYEIIEAFIYYLSFVRGFWVAPLFVKGYDSEGNQILEEWRIPTIKASSWLSGNYSWCYIDSTEIIDTFPGFMKKWQDQTWREVIKNSIQWYIESFTHQNGYNTSIILIQSALENLSWIYLSGNNFISPGSFQKLTVDDKIRLLIKSLQIELLPMSEEWEAIKLAKKHGWISTWLDSINLIGQIRNLIVHPKVNQKDNRVILTETIMSEVFQVGHYYLQQCLLKLFEYPFEENDNFQDDDEEAE
ncbi:hypothetical protein V0288_23150 [Pannus brasiliensis CCIBt3594]|uniref:YopA central domain-containing protein n=1 Tax=Pannus brasiliensis CCIBt3594 TaxID=1427578 RepID=A0AAW9QSZ9_9CHRO